jgi:hypothetical protein
MKMIIDSNQTKIIKIEDSKTLIHCLEFRIIFMEDLDKEDKDNIIDYKACLI